MNGSIQGPGASATPDVLSYSRTILAAMNGGTVPPPRMTSDQLGSSDAKRGQVPSSTPLVGPQAGQGQAPPDLMIDQTTGQLFTEDGKPYLGRALFLQGDESVVDAQGKAVDLSALERAAGYNPDLLTTAPAGGQTQGAGQAPPDIFTGPQGNIVTADGQPYLGKMLYLQDDQTVVDAQGNLVNLAELEQAAGYAPPAPPAPPQYYRGPNDQLVDVAGQPYLGVTMFVNGDQLIDANGQEVDLNTLIAQAGYDPNQDPAPETAQQPAPTDPAQYGPPQTGVPQPEARTGENKTVGIVRNLLAVAGDYRRWRAAQAPAEGDATTTATGTKPARKPRNPSKAPPVPKTKGTGKTQSTTGTKATTTKKTTVNPDSPIPGTRDMRITKGAQQDFRARKAEIHKSYTGQARLPREAQQLTDAQRVRMRSDVREHQVATKQFKESYLKVQKWNKQDPGKLTTTEHRQMVRDQQTLELAQKQVQKTEAKLNDWYKKIGKKPVDTVVTLSKSPRKTPTPTSGPRQVSVPNTTRKAFQTEWTRFTAENTQAMSVKKTLGAKLTAAQQNKLIADVQQHQLSKNHLTWKKAEVETLTAKPKLTAAQQRKLVTNQQLVTLSERNLQKTSAKLQTWETKLGHKISVTNRNGKTEIGLGRELSATTKTTGAKTTATKGTVKTGSVKSTTRKPSAAPEVKTGLKPITGRILPGLLALNDAYSLYQGVSHWNDEGNTGHIDDAMRVGGSALSTYASVQAFRKGNLGAGIGLHATGVALNLLGQMTNDQD